MQKNNKTISEKEWIKNKNIVKILNYFEEQWKCQKAIGVNGYKFLNNLSLSIWFKSNKCIIPKNWYLLEMPIKIFAENLEGLYLSLKNYIK